MGGTSVGSFFLSFFPVSHLRERRRRRRRRACGPTLTGFNCPWLFFSFFSGCFVNTKTPVFILEKHNNNTAEIHVFFFQSLCHTRNFILLIFFGRSGVVGHAINFTWRWEKKLLFFPISKPPTDKKKKEIPRRNHFFPPSPF